MKLQELKELIKKHVVYEEIEGEEEEEGKKNKKKKKRCLLSPILRKMKNVVISHV